MVTTKPFSKNLEQQFELSHTKAQTKITTYNELCKHFGRRDEEADKNGCFHWTLTSPSLKLNCWAQLRVLTPIFLYAMAYLNRHNLTWITNFRSRILLADAHCKHNLIILVADSQNFRKLQEWFSEFEWDESRTQKRKSNRLLIKKWNFSRMSILRTQNSISWAGVITNDAVLSMGHRKNMKSFSLHPKVHQRLKIDLI